MNIIYWLVVFALLVVALLIVIPPLWKKRVIKYVSPDQRNIKIAQDKAKDLKHQLQVGGLTQAQFKAQYAELELTLDCDLSTEKHIIHVQTSGRYMVFVIALLLPVCSVLIYFLIGEPNALQKASLSVQQAKTNKLHPSNQAIEAMITKLAQHLKDNPNNPQGWLLLGRSYNYLKHYQLAVDAYKNAYSLLSDNPDIMLQYASTLTLLNQGELSAKAKKLITKALEIAPEHEAALWLNSVVKVETGELTQALKHLRKLQTLLPVDSDFFKKVQDFIVSIQASGQGSVSNSVNVLDKIAEPNFNPISGITVRVNLATTLKHKVSLEDTVFIYAQALTGPSMPLAVVRKRVADLPLTVTLNDNMAMMPQMQLSNFKQVKIIARISKSGKVTPQTGDFVGVLQVKNRTNMPTLVVVIKQILN